jgi:membrane-bound lytic murein transglycosylase MltF
MMRRAMVMITESAKGGMPTSPQRHIGGRGLFVLFLSFISQLSALSLPAFSQDLAEIKASGIIRHLGIPYANFISGGGDGMDVELIKLFAKELGVKYSFVRTDWANAIGDLTGTATSSGGNDGVDRAKVPVKGDLVANGMTVIPSREKVVNFSAPTFRNQVWLVARAEADLKPIKPSGNLERDIAAVKALLRNRSVLGKKNTCLDPDLYDINATGARVKLFQGGLNDLAPALLKGEAELTLLDIPDALVALQKWPGKIKVIGPVSGMQDMAVAFRKDSPHLREAFDSFFVKIKRRGIYSHIAEKYYPFVNDYIPGFSQGL